MSCSNSEPPDDGGASENQLLMQFAHADCDHLVTHQKSTPFQLVCRGVKIPFKAVWYLLYLPCWRQHMSLTEIKQTRDAFAPNANRKSWISDVIQFYFVNWLLLHLYEHIRTLDLDINDGKHAAYIIREVWKRTFGGSGGFFQLYAELRPRDYADFCKRDTSHFKENNGNIFTKDTREALYFILILSYRGNKFVRLLYSWSYELIDKELIKIGKDLPLYKVLMENPDRRLSQIKNIRRESLERLETYANNMLRFAIDSGSIETAALWNDVVCKIRGLKGFRPSPESYGKLSRLISEMVEQFNAAGKRTYVIYRSQEQATPILPESTKNNTARTDSPIELPLETKTHSRFKILIYEKRYEITDTQQNKRPYKITKASNAGGIVWKLILNYATGTDQTHISNDTWKGAFQSGRGDATRFKNEQIFILPRWDAEKRHFILTQKSNRWRLWTDEELKMSKSERMKKFIAEHPNGLPK